jgi:N-acetylneuraminate epimerase
MCATDILDKAKKSERIARSFGLKAILRLIGGIAILLIVSPVAASDWNQLPSLPTGLAGSFAGVSNGALLVAGGTNFPDKKPWEGGAKAWYDTVFVLERSNREWKTAGRLPRPLGYGVSAKYASGVVCVGGSDGRTHFRDVFRLEWRDGKLVTTELSPLPKPIANSCGALVGDTLYIAGGIEQPDAAQTTKDVWALDLGSAEPKWKSVAPVPERGRMLAVAAAVGDSFYVVSGVDLSAENDGTPVRHYLRDGYRYNPGEGWKQIADVPRPVVAAPSPAPMNTDGFYVLGGDDGAQVGRAPEAHRGFSRSILKYQPSNDTWTELGATPAPHVTTPCVLWNKLWVVPGGEMRPGVRSPEVWTWRQDESR